MYFRMSQEGVFFPAAREVHPRYHTPAKALTIAMVWSCILVLSGTFDQLTDMLIFAAFIFYAAGALGLILAKRRGQITARTFGYPWMPIIFIVFCIVLVGNTLYVFPKESMTGLLLILIGLPAWWYFTRKGRS